MSMPKAGAFVFQEHEHIDVIIGQVLDGDDSIPEKVTVTFSDALGASDTIDCRASSVKFS